MTRSCRLLLTTAFISLGGAAPALAQMDCAALQSEISTGLTSLLAQPSYSAFLQKSGDVTAEASGEGCRVSLPALRIGPAEASGGLEVGVISLDVTAPDDDTYEVTANIPTEMKALDDSGMVVGSITHSNPRSITRWDRNIGAVMFTDTALNDVALRVQGEDVEVKIGTLATNVDYKSESGDGIVDGVATMTLANLSVTQAGAPLLSVGTMTGTSELEGFNYAGYMQLLPLTDAVTTAVEQGQGEDKALDDLIAFFEATPGLMGDRMTGGVVLKDLQFTAPNNEGTVRLGEVSYSAMTDNLTEARGMGGLEIGFSGLQLDVADIPADAKPLIPGNAGLKLSLNEIPNGDVYQTIRGIIDLARQEQPDMIPMKGMELMQKMAEAGTNLKLDSLSFASPALQASGQGQLNFNAQAAYQVDGGVAISIAGLDNTIQDLQARGASNPDLAQAAQGLAMLQAFGREEALADGRKTRIYDIKVQPDGQILLNGADMSAMMGGMMGGGAAPQ